MAEQDKSVPQQAKPDNLVDDDVLIAVEEAQYLVNYIVHNGSMKINMEFVKTLVEAKHRLADKTWDKDFEIEFWMAFDSITECIYPISVDSLKANLHSSDDENSGVFSKKKTPAGKVVQRYGVYTIVTLAFLLIFQIYWIIGSQLYQNVTKNYGERNALAEKVLFNDKREDFLSPEQVSPEFQSMKSRLAEFNQTLDANYDLLISWNKVWQFVTGRQSFQGTLTRHVNFQYDQINAQLNTALERKKRQLRELEEGLSSEQIEDNESVILIKQRIDEISLEQSLTLARNRLFKNLSSASFIINMLQAYILPILFGLLGSFIFVLRSLARSVRGLVYTSYSKINYRLRTQLGALAGLFIGWFFKPEDVQALGSIGPLVLSFLAGYNIEILFSAMDSLTESLRKKSSNADGPVDVFQQNEEPAQPVENNPEVCRYFPNRRKEDKKEFLVNEPEANEEFQADEPEANEDKIDSQADESEIENEKE